MFNLFWCTLGGRKLEEVARLGSSSSSSSSSFSSSNSESAPNGDDDRADEERSDDEAGDKEGQQEGYGADNVNEIVEKNEGSEDEAGNASDGEERDEGSQEGNEEGEEEQADQDDNESEDGEDREDPSDDSLIKSETESESEGPAGNKPPRNKKSYKLSAEELPDLGKPRNQKKKKKAGKCNFSFKNPGIFFFVPKPYVFLGKVTVEILPKHQQLLMKFELKPRRVLGTVLFTKQQTNQQTNKPKRTNKPTNQPTNKSLVFFLTPCLRHLARCFVLDFQPSKRIRLGRRRNDQSFFGTRGYTWG